MRTNICKSAANFYHPPEIINQRCSSSASKNVGHNSLAYDNWCSRQSGPFVVDANIAITDTKHHENLNKTEYEAHF